MLGRETPTKSAKCTQAPVATVFIAAFVAAVLALTPFAASAQEIDSKKLLAGPKTYVGSDVCRTCHLEHYDAWKRTLHSKML